MEGLLDWLERLDGRLVGNGPFGPLLPQVREPTVDLKAVRRDAIDVARDRDGLGHPALPRIVTADNREVAVQRRERFEKEKRKHGWYPGCHVTRRLEASSLARLGGYDAQQIGEALELRGTVTNHSKGLARFRTVPATIARGDSDWARLGAWPWTAFLGADGAGAMPDKWWQDGRAADALALYAQRESERKRERARLLDWQSDALLHLVERMEGSQA